MSRRQRLHVTGGMYYVVQSGSTHQPIFSEPEDYKLFERLLSATLQRTGARVHAFCWTPQAIHLVMQIETISIGRVMQGLTSGYARSMHKRAGKSGHFFQHRYRTVLVDPNEYLLRLVRFIHDVPHRADPARGACECAYTSHDAYLGRSSIPWLATRSVLRLIERCRDCSTYAALMERPPAAEDAALFGRVMTSDLHVIGGPEYLASLPRHLRTYRTKASLDQIIDTVTCTLGVEREHVLSSSRRRELSLARALIAWYATERGVATLSEVARQLRRDPSTLSIGISRYRMSRPELFKLTAIHDIVPLATIGSRATQGWENAAVRETLEDENGTTA